MAPSFFFYDLETSGFNPREARIMQFAGQRTDLSLQPIGHPVNVFIKITEDILPDPQAILITGITPQKTLAEGITEAEFLNVFTREIGLPGTIFVGYNSVRFDDEFMRFIHYRNLYDPYEWQWKDYRSRWDLLDAVRMTRALRPAGIKWPIDTKGQPTNRLELLAAENNLLHDKAHDALSDVRATIALAQLIKDKQPKLFNFLLSLRDKKAAAKLVQSRQPIVYTSGKFPSEFEKTTIVTLLAEHPHNQGALVYDLRYDPEPFANMSAQELAEAWRWHQDESILRLPVKTLQFNRCPAVAPLSVLDEASQQRLKLNMAIINEHYKKLQDIRLWPQRLLEALELLDAEQTERAKQEIKDVDAQLYDGFFEYSDKKTMTEVRTARPSELSQFASKFHDSRLKSLLALYIARNFPESLSPEELHVWQAHKTQKLLSGAENSRFAKFEAQVQAIAAENNLTLTQKKLLKELQAYAEQATSESDGDGELSNKAK